MAINTHKRKVGAEKIMRGLDDFERPDRVYTPYEIVCQVTSALEGCAITKAERVRIPAAAALILAEQHHIRKVLEDTGEMPEVAAMLADGICRFLDHFEDRLPDPAPQRKRRGR